MKKNTSRRFFPVYPIVLLVSFFVINPTAVYALDNGQARTPPMGWNSWNVFRNDVNETIIKEMADKIVSTGLADAGYNYVCIDDGWYVEPNANTVNTTKFPNGIKAVADYVHAKGLKVGIYTCWDSRGNETRDASAWAAWGIDYVKHDSWKQYSTETAIWTTMRDAILATKRPIVYSVHFQDRAKVIGNPKIMNMWRFTNDLVAYYDRVKLPSNKSWGVTTVDILSDMGRVAAITGPGCWADADMLMVGVKNETFGNQTLDEWKTAFAISCILPSPLIISVDIRNTPQAVLDIFLNKELVAVNQDTLARSWKVRDDGLRKVWARRLSDGSYAVVFFNTDVAAPMQVSWPEIKEANGKALVRDLWLNQNVDTFSNSYSVNVPTHGTAFLKITPERFITKTRDHQSVRAKGLSQGAIVQAENGAITISLREYRGTSLQVVYTLTTLLGTSVSRGAWTKEPGNILEKTLKVPGGCRTGTYIVRLKIDNQELNIHEEIQKKVYIR